MPHQCTNCGRAFDDGSKEMLSGCPDCGGNKFQFKPDGADGSATADPPDPPERPDSPTGSSVARTVGKTAATVRDLVGSDPTAPEGQIGADPAVSSTPEGEPTESATAPGDGLAGARDPTGSPPAEDTAQASARSEIVTPDELPSEPESDEHRFRPVSTPEAEAEDGADGDSAPDRPDLDELRAELNDQFESIKVLDPGKYELNLMELYDRDEYIIALQEDGRYSIQVPENFRD